MIRSLVIFVLCNVASEVISSPVVHSAKHVPAIHPISEHLSKSFTPVSNTSEKCQQVNEEFDRALKSANWEVLQNISVPVEGFQKDVYLTYNGASILVKFYLQTSKGSLRLNVATRLGDAVVCHEETDRRDAEEILKGALQFGRVEIKYDKLNTRYLQFFNFDGTLELALKPTVYFVAARSSDNCRLDFGGFQEASQAEYTVTSDSWRYWLAAKTVGRSLGDGGDSTPMMQYILEGLKNSIEAHFLKIWCKQ